MALKVLILGVNGFIGSSLAETILKTRDWEVSGMDIGTHKLNGLLNHPRFKFVEGDILINKEWIEYQVKKCDVVLPLVAIANPIQYVRQPLQVFELDFDANLAIVRQVVRYKKRLIFPSTSEVYGKSVAVPFSEEADLVMGPTTKHRWAYACSKAIDELLALAYYKERGLPVVIARLFNTVGPRQTGRYGMVIPNFVRQALAGEPITVFGDGTQQRAFTHVTDVVGALLKLVVEPKAIGQVINIGNKNEITIQALAERVRELSGSNSIIKLIPYDEAYESGFEDMPRRVPDLTRIRGLIGYEPKHELDEILTQVIDYFRKK